MLINRYIEESCEYELRRHMENKCYCDLTEGGKGLCVYGRYIEGQLTPQEFLKELNDSFENLQYGTFIRSELDEIARVIGVESIKYNIWFILDRTIDIENGHEYIKSNKIRPCDVEKHSNVLKDLVKIGDIVNGHKIIKIEGDKLYYGYWGDNYIHGEVNEVLTKKDYLRHIVES